MKEYKKKSNNILFFILFFTFILYSYEAFAKLEYRVAPKLKSFFLYYPTEIAGAANIHYTIRGELYGKYKWKKKWTLLFQPLIEYSPTAKEIQSSILDAKSNSERFFYQFKKAYLSLRLNQFRILLGKKIHAWGVHEGFSPLDLINSFRYINPINTEKIANFALELNWSLSSSMDMELVYIPIKNKSILPGEDSRWLPRAIYLNRAFDGIRFILPPDLRYHYQEAEELDHALHNNFAFRIRKKSSHLDLSFVYFEGAANSPSINLELSANGNFPGNSAKVDEIMLNPDLGLIPVYYKKRSYGANLVYNWRDMLLRAEAVFSKQISTATNKALPGDSTELAMSAEKKISLMGKSFTSLVQGNWGNYESSPENGTTSLSRIFESGLLFALRYSHSTELSFIASIFADLKYSGNIYTFYSNYKLWNNLTATASINIVSGKGLTPLGTYAENDLFSFNIEYNF